MNTRAHVIVSGRVQGVFFRQATKSAAKKHNVVGWVRNLPDGRVEAIFEGKKEDVESMVEYCRLGPSAAYVRSLETAWEGCTGEFTEFKIIH